MLNVVLNVVFIPLLGIMGAVVATGISFMLLSGFELYVVTKFTDFKPPLAFIVKFIPIITLPAMLTLWLGGSGLWWLMLSAVLYAMVVIHLTARFLPLTQQELALLAAVTPRTVKLMRKYKLLRPAWS